MPTKHCLLLRRPPSPTLEARNAVTSLPGKGVKMLNLLTIVACLTSVCVGDVIRTVYCKNQCTDYLGIPENSMPLCAAEHLKLLECGTVITCDWADAERDKVRSVANSSDILCCYRTVIKEKGDCAEPVQPNSDATVEQQEAVSLPCV
ncbi:unnamed protein product [Heligmosomoides polygyrus]|uniref:Activin_recp domain-containing protein n=1 Tax=Heligmosomoides polygyrus TaxID=6339 RepID=A0A183G680_HELPZ|nr:unnamed protein product [Heligmosomoides polygyrus]